MKKNMNTKNDHRLHPQPTYRTDAAEDLLRMGQTMLYAQTMANIFSGIGAYAELNKMRKKGDH